MSFALQPKRETFVAIAVFAAAVLALVGLLITFKAASFMLSLRYIKNEDVPQLQHAFDSSQAMGWCEGCATDYSVFRESMVPCSDSSKYS